MLIVNADLYLPNISEDNKSTKIGECCQGLVNLELTIHHLSTLKDAEKSQTYDNISSLKTDDEDFVRVVSGKAMQKIVSRIPSKAGKVVFDVGQQQIETYTAFVHEVYNNLAELKADGAPRYSDKTLKVARDKLLKSLAPLSRS